jgi:hypothetical protein
MFFQSSVKTRNPHMDSLSEDVLYHLGLSTASHDLKEMFGDVKVSRLNSFHNEPICHVRRAKILLGQLC